MAPHPSPKILAAGLGAALALLSSAVPAAAQPDLVPLLNTPMNASVGMQNIGTSDAGPSHLTINCNEFGQADGGCPDAPGMGAYVDPAFPNRLVIDVPALAPNESFSHDLGFWNAIPWTPGTYVFDAQADAGQDIAESNEANNATQSSHTQQAAVGVAPPPPLPLATRPAPAKLDSATIFQLRKQRTAERPQRPAPRLPEAPRRTPLAPAK